MWCCVGEWQGMLSCDYSKLEWGSVKGYGEANKKL